MPPVPLLDTPLGPFGHHPSKFAADGVDTNPLAPTPAGTFRNSSVISLVEVWLHVRQREVRSNQPHAAIDVVADTAGRNDSVLHIERGDTRRSEIHSPNGRPACRAHSGGCRAGRLHWSLAQRRRIHGLENGPGRVDAGRHQHAGFFHAGISHTSSDNTSDRHVGVQFHMSSTTLAVQRPPPGQRGTNVSSPLSHRRGVPGSD